MESNQNLLTSDIIVDSSAAAHLKETAMWAKLMGVVGIVLSILIGLMGLFAGTMLATMTRKFGGDSSESLGALGSGMITIFYLFIAVIYFFLSLYLFRFAVKMKLALQISGQEQFNASLMNLKLVYRIMGIILIIYLAFLALALLAVIGAALFMK